MYIVLFLILALGAVASEPDEQYCARLREQSGSVRDADEIEPGLWLGNVCAAVDAEFLREQGIQVVVNMASEWQTDALCTKGDTTLMRFFYSVVPWRHCFPLDDTSAQSSALVEHRLGWAAWRIRTAREEGYTVLVHCNMGVSRSAAAVLRYLLDKDERLAYSEALAAVSRARPIARPNALFEALLDSVDERKRRWKLKHAL